MPARARDGNIPANAFAARLIALAGILTLAVLAQLRGGGAYSNSVLSALYLLVLAGFLLALAYGALAAWSPWKRLHLLELAGDAVLISGFVYCSGGPRSIFGFLFIIWIVYAALTLGSRGALLACAFATVAQLTIAWGPIAGWFPPYSPEFAISSHEIGSAVGAHAIAFLAVTLLARRLAAEVQAGREELQELGELHRRIVDNVSSGLLTVTRAGTISSFNREAERITGATAAEVVGLPLGELFPTLGTLDPGDRQRRIELEYLDRAGRKLHLGMSLSWLRNGRGEADGAIVIFQDLTHLVEMEEQLRKSERLGAIGQLAAGLAHEIRNPLASLSGAIELLAADLPASDRHSQTLSQIVQRETARLNRLVSDFLTYARPGPGRSEPVALLSLFQEMAELIARDASLGIELRLDVAGGLSVLGNADQLRQVFWNLVLNAAQSEPRDRAVHVAARRVGDGVEVTIEDHGCGIASETMDRIFEPFYTTKPKGTGLGLATVHRVVEAHGGRIGITSELGVGTTVRVVLPTGSSSS
ncbi:MAG TPA: ATP-binding protein [Myxococcota bacterium]|nr:ATP-binding protein [Myxococcota bacterium]